MKTVISKKYLVVLIGALGVVSEGWASEWFVLNPLEWKAVLEFDGSKRTGAAGDAKDIRFDESIRLRQSGYSLDPRIATFSLELNPVWSQGDFDSPNGDDNLDGSFLNYDMNLSLLHGTPGPVSFNAQAMRSSGTNDFSLGGRSDFETEHQRLALNWKTSIFPSTFSYTERSLDQTFRSGFSGTISERDDILRTLSFKGRSSKTGITLEYSDFDDMVFDRDFTEERARFSHSARWGKGSHLNSRMEFVDREGFRAYENFYVAENARLQHTKNLYSSYRLDHSTVTQELETRRNSAGLGLTHRLYQNLTTSFELSGTSTDFELGEQGEYGARLDLNYNKKIAWGGGKLSAGIGANRRIVDRTAVGGLLEVIDESHVVDITMIIVLDERFIDTTTIVITDAAGLVVFTEGADYLVVPVANNLTEIQILPSGLINVGDTILVDYRYESAPSMKYSANTFNYRAALDFGWISLFHRAFSSDQDVISGAAGGFLTDRRESTSGVRFRWTRPNTQATFDVETRFLQSGDFESDSYILRQSLVHTLSPITSLTLSASETFTAGEGTEFDLFNVDLSLRWRPQPNLSVTPRVGTWSRDEPGVSTQRFITAGLDLKWAVRKLMVTVSFKHNEWGGTINDSNEDRLMFTVVRRSR